MGGTEITEQNNNFTNQQPAQYPTQPQKPVRYPNQPQQFAQYQNQAPVMMNNIQPGAVKPPVIAWAYPQLWIISLCYTVGILLLAFSNFSKYGIEISFVGMVFPLVLSARQYGVKCIGTWDFDYLQVLPDGTTRPNYQANVKSRVGGALVALFFGGIITPIRYGIYVKKYQKACKETGYTPDFIHSWKCPTIVMAVGIIIAILMTI